MAFSAGALVTIIALVMDGTCFIYFAVFHVIAFDQLKKGHKTPEEQCLELNQVLFLELVLVTFLNILFLLFKEFFSLALNLPVLIYYALRYRGKSKDDSELYGQHAYHPTTIMSRKEFIQG